MLRRLSNTTRAVNQAKLTREPFGHLLIYFDRATGQLRSMTAGSVEAMFTKLGPASMIYCAGGKLHSIVTPVRPRCCSISTSGWPARRG